MKYTFVSIETNERFELELKPEEVEEAKKRFIKKYKFNCYYFTSQENKDVREVSARRKV